MKSCSIEGLGYAPAKRHVINEGLSTFVDTNDEWISNRTGIRAGCISEEENTSNLGVHAARMVVNKSGIDPKEIDLIITTTFALDQTTPPTACLIQEKPGLGKQHIMASDLGAACSGFLYALQSAHVILAAGRATYALTIGAEVIPKQLSWNDRSTCIIFAGGVGVAVMKQEDMDKRMLRFAGSMGNAVGTIHNNAPKPRPLFPEQPYQPSVVCMEGSTTFRFAVKTMQEAIEDVPKQAGERIEDIGWIVPRQANVGTTSDICKRMYIDKEHVYISTKEYGSTSATSIPLALEEMSKKDLLQPGMGIVPSGFGTGFIWAGCYVEL